MPRTISGIRAALGLTLCVVLAAATPLRGQAHGGPEEPHDPLPPPLIAPVIVPPGEEPKLAPRAAPAITFEERVLELVNEERLANGGLPPLKGVTELFSSSETHSFNMADRDFFAHCDVDTNTRPADRMTAAGYTGNAAPAENIAAGYSTPEDAMAGWMASLGHRAVILSTSYREVGVGHFEQPTDQDSVRLDGDGDCTADGIHPFSLFHYWTQDFGRRNSVYPMVIDREAHDTPATTVNLYLYGAGWAQEMRFSNDGCSWSGWQTFATETPWVLEDGGGNKTVRSQIRNGATVLENLDSIVLEAPCDEPLALDLSSMTVNACEVYEACDTVSAGEAFQVGSSGDVTFIAGDRVVLRDGFSVATGGVFRAFVDPAIP